MVVKNDGDDDDGDDNGRDCVVMDPDIIAVIIVRLAYENDSGDLMKAKIRTLATYTAT